MPIPFLSSINLTKNEVENFKIYNLANDPGTLTSGGDFGYFWLNTSSQKTLKWWDGANVRSIVDSTNIGSFTSGLATDLAGGAGGYLPYQIGTNDTTFLPLGAAAQILAVNSGLTGPEWINQSAITAGAVANALTAGTYLTSGGTYNGSAARTFAVDATDANTASKVVARDASGNFSAGTITASLSGNATSADSVNNALTAGTYLTSGGTFNGSVARTFAVDATSANTASKIVARDASGNFSAGTITATTVTGLSAPSAGSDAANRDYVDSVAQGLDIKASCLVATTGDITLSSPGAISIDNIPSTSFTSGTTRILVRAQNTASQNGIYIWNGSGSAMTRSADANTWDELVSAFTFIEQGDTLKDTGWVCTIDAGTLGTTAVTWSQFSGAGSYTANRGLVLSGTVFNFAQNSDYTVGDLPYATGQTTIGLLPAVATGNALISGGVATAPSWGKIGLTTHVSGTLPIANGGTGATTFTQGQVLFAGASTISSSANLFWDNSNNRLGIGTSTPNNPLTVRGSQDSGIEINSADSNASRLISAYDPAGNRFYINSTFNGTGTVRDLDFLIANNNHYKIANNGVFTWFDGAGGTRMTLNANGLGVGIGPVAGYKITTNGNLGLQYGSELRLINTDNSSAYAIKSVGTGGGNKLYFTVPGIGDRMVLDYNGNLGIGTVTPGGKLEVNIGSETTAIPIFKFVGASNSWNGNFSFDAVGNLTSYAYNGTKFTDFIWLYGNLGLGVTPSAWGYSGVLQTDKAALLGLGNSMYLGNNWRYSAGVSYKIATGYAFVYEQNRSVGSHIFYTSSTGAGSAGDTITFNPLMTLDASGRLLVGTASARSNFFNSSVTTQLQVEGDGAASFVRNVNDVYGGVLVLGKIRGASIVQNNDRVSQISFQGSDGSEFVECANISAEIDGAPGANDMPGRLVFSTTSDGAAAPTERLRIKSTGQVNFVGLASDPAGAAGDVYYNSTAKALKLYATDWKTLPRKAVVQGGAGTGTTIAVAHNLNTNNVSVTVLRTTDNVVVFTDVAITDADTVTITFASAVTKADYTVTVIG